MIKILLLFSITAFCELIILSPPELSRFYPNRSIVPSVTAILRKFPIISQGNVGFLPNDINPCEESSWPQSVNYTVFAIMSITCDYLTVAEIAEKRGAEGVIFVLNLPSSKLKDVLISTDVRSPIFIVGISNEHIDIWRKIQQGLIMVSFERDWIYYEKPSITIALSGNYYYDAQFIKEWYSYLIPIVSSDMDIDLYFNYSFGCSSCSTFDCYSDNKYCMIDNTNHANGREMIDRTLFEIALLNYVIANNLYFGTFAIFLYEIGNSCSNDYSPKCAMNVLNWLKVDSAYIQGVINASWMSNLNMENWDNRLLRWQHDKWVLKNYSQPIPSISIGNITLGLGQGYGVGGYICNYISYAQFNCDDVCGGNDCTIDDLDNGHCDGKCKEDSCFYDIQDCNGLHDFCSDIHTHVCKYSDGGLSKTSVILIAVFSCAGFFLCWTFCSACFLYFIGKRLKVRVNENSSEVPESAPDNNFPLPSSPSLPPSQVPRHIMHRLNLRRPSSANESRPDFEIIIYGGENVPDSDRQLESRFRAQNNIPLQRRIPRVRFPAPDSSNDIRLDSEISSDSEIDYESSMPLEIDSEIRPRAENNSENNNDYGFFGDATCSICFDAITEENMKITRCKHIFHKDCLKAWTDAKGRNAKCPNCNLEMH